MRVRLLALGIGRAGMTGSQRYLDCLESGLKQLGETRLHVDSLRELGRPRPWRRTVERFVLGSWALTGFPTASRFAGKIHPDVVHLVESVIVPRAGRCRLVVTVHDMCALLRPELVERRVAVLKRLSRRRLLEPDWIIVPSETTFRDLVSLGADRSRITVIRHGVSPALAEGPTPKAIEKVRAIAGDQSFVITVGQLSRKRGADVLLKAWARVADQLQARLLWVGRAAKDEQRLIEALAGERGARSIVRLDAVDDELLAALYSQASVVVSASRWEGFGFPVAEALVLGKPVIASDIPAHCEFGSPGVHTFPSENPLELAELIMAALNTPLKAARQRFPSWTEVARAHAEVYAGVC